VKASPLTLQKTEFYQQSVELLGIPLEKLPSEIAQLSDILIPTCVFTVGQLALLSLARKKL
jgi:hypothetical protein